MGDGITIVQGQRNPSVGAQTAADLQTSDLKSPASGMSPLMSGASLEVTSGATTDLEKLVAQLKNENDDARLSVAHRRIAILKTVLDSMAFRISETQRMNLMSLERLSVELSTVEVELKGFEAEKAAAESRSAELDAKIKALEEAIKQAIEDGEAHRDQMEELKRQKEQEDAKIRRLTNSIESAANKIAEMKGKVAEYTAAIGAATLDEVAAAVKAAAGEVKPASDDDSNSDREKDAKKIEEQDVVSVIRDALDKISADLSRTIEEKRLHTV